MYRIPTVLLLALTLAGCFQAQLNGGIAAADITVATLSAPQQPLHQLHSHGPQSMIAWKGQAAWDAYNTYQKAVWMGVFSVPAAALEADTLYLVTASKGSNRDSDVNMQLDADQVPVRGNWHAIVPGRQFGDYRNKVSLLTEASYQSLLFDTGGKLPDDGAVLAWLDRAAAAVVEDINGDGVVNYSDILAWNIYIDVPRYKGDEVMLEQLAVMITLNFPSHDIVRAAREIMLMLPAAEMREPGLIDYLRTRSSPAGP